MVAVAECESVKLVRSGQEVYAVEMVLLTNTSSREDSWRCYQRRGARESETPKR